MLVVLLVVAALLALATTQALAGWVLWKQSCPTWATLEYYPEQDGSAMNVVCVLGNAAKEVTTDNNR